MKVFSEINHFDQKQVFKTDTMQVLRILFLLAHQLRTTFGLRVIDNGLGLPVFGAEEKMVNYAFLASDQKAALPTQVLIFINHLKLFYPVHHLFVCIFRPSLNQPLLFPTSSPVFDSVGLAFHAPAAERGTHVQIFGELTPSLKIHTSCAFETAPTFEKLAFFASLIIFISLTISTFWAFCTFF